MVSQTTLRGPLVSAVRATNRVGKFTQTRSVQQQDCAFQRHNTIATLLHTVHIAATTLDSCRIMICMRFARCVHSRTDVKSHHKHRVESPCHAYTPIITPVRHRSKHPAEPPVPPRDIMFRVGTSVVTCHRRRNPRCRAPHWHGFHHTDGAPMHYRNSS